MHTQVHVHQNTFYVICSLTPMLHKQGNDDLQWPFGTSMAMGIAPACSYLYQHRPTVF